MRSTLAVTIVLMGALGMLLALATGEIYRKDALENQRAALKSVMQIGVAEQLRALQERALDLGLAMQSESRFRRALAGGSGPVLGQELQNQLRQYDATAKLIRLDRIAVYDADYRLRTSASASMVFSSDDPAGCPKLIEQARRRAASERPRAIDTLCTTAGQVRYAVLVPMTAPLSSGFLLVVTDPVAVLSGIDKKLGAPVRIRDMHDHRLFVSEDWPPAQAMSKVLVAETTLSSSSGEPTLKVAMMRDVEPLLSRLRHTRYLVMSTAGVATLLGVLLAFYIVEKTALEPLNALTQHLRDVGNNKEHLGKQVQIGGIAEFRELADDFNHMARELDRLYGSLEHMAFTDPLTNLPNRARFRDSLEESVRQHANAHRPFALFLMDLDRFKNVNDTLGHQVGDLLLQEVSVRLRGVLRESDTVARLDHETILGFEGKMVARLGGDEFSAILPRVQNMDDAGSIAHKLLLSMQEPFLIRGHAISVGLSIGITLYPLHGTEIDTLMQRTDAAMYFAKNNHCGFAFPDAVQPATLV
jgi:GGDEF domain-containing protein